MGVTSHVVPPTFIVSNGGCAFTITSTMLTYDKGMYSQQTHLTTPLIIFLLPQEHPCLPPYVPLFFTALHPPSPHIHLLPLSV